MSKSWSLADDTVVWQALGHLPITASGSRSGGKELIRALATRFGRTEGAIRARMQHLDDPTHAAHARMHGRGAQPPAKRQATAARASPADARAPLPPGPSASAPPAAAQPAAAPAAPAVRLADLNAGQRDAFERVRAGQNVFLTGAAGTGKSFLLRAIVESLEARLFGAGRVAVVAPTGIAASHIGGQTIHAWAGIGLGRGDEAKLLAKVQSSADAVHRWRVAAALVIDEISMLDGALFGALEGIARALRASGAAFGGLQLVLCGDFFQLPPVSLAQGRFAFQSAAWLRCAVRACVLDEIVRQQGDASFVALLNEVRVGVCSAATTATLAACHVAAKPRPTDGIVPTRLYCTNKDVDAENASHLGSLDGVATAHAAVDTFKRAPASHDTAKRVLDALERKAPALLALKVGAQVMLTKNWPDASLVNGSRGVVVGFEHAQVHEGERACYGVKAGRHSCVLVRFDNGQTHVVKPASTFQAVGGEACVRVQLPLKLAWALTVHKSQGMTLSRCELLLEDAFSPGQAYVALSRCTSLAGLWLSGGAITQQVVRAHPAVVRFYQEVRAQP